MTFMYGTTLKKQCLRNMKKSLKKNKKRCEMKIVAVIPARYGSSRFPGKPLALINSKPMIQHVYERVNKVSNLDRVVVATDNAKIYDAVLSFGGEVVMTKDTHESGSDRMAEVS